MNHGLEVVDTPHESSLHFGNARARNRPLQREPDSEQPLYDVVVQVAGDAVTVCKDAQFAHLSLRARQLPRQGRLVGERGHHVELVGAERRGAGRPQRHKNTGDRRPLRAAAAGAPDRWASGRRGRA